MAVTGLSPAEHRRRTIVSGLVALVARTARSGLLLGSGILLARLLTPEEFGVFAMVVPLGVLGSGFANNSFQTVLLQHPAFEDVDALFWFAARVNLLVVGGMVAAGFGLAAFYAEPRVIAIAAIWAATIYLLTLTGFREALLKRELRFPAVLLVQVLSVAVSVVVSITAAVRGAGYWSLPLQVFVMEFSRAIGIRLVSGWRPRRPMHPQPESMVAMRRDWRALAALTAASWVNDQPDLVAVGRLGGAPVLGLYDTARRWSWYPFAEPFFAVSEVALASLSSVHEDQARYKRLFTRAVLVMLTVSMPVIALVGVEAPSVIRVLLGPQWGSAAPFMRLLSVAAFVGAVEQTTHWIYLSQKRTRRLLRWSLLVQAPSVGVAVVVGLPGGPLGVAAAMATVTLLLLVPAVRYAVHGTSLTARDVFHAASRPALASLAAAALLAAVGSVLPEAPGVGRLGAGLAVFLVGLTVAWIAIPGGPTATRELVEAFRDFRPAERV